MQYLHIHIYRYKSKYIYIYIYAHPYCMKTQIIAESYIVNFESKIRYNLFNIYIYIYIYICYAVKLPPSCQFHKLCNDTKINYFITLLSTVVIIEVCAK